VRGGALPPALLCAALGFALAFAPRRTVPVALALTAAAALAASFLGVPLAWQDGVFLGCWASVVVAALSIHLPGGVGPRLALVLAINSGFWVGAVIAAAGSRLDLLKSLPVALLCLPGAWLVSTRKGLAIKVAASWLIAVSILAAALPLIPTPGYKPDHME
jgi:hypothetical protein